MDDRLERCRRLYRFVFQDYLPSHHVDAIVLSARWEPSEFAQLQDTIEWARSYGLQVVVIGPGPEFDVALPHLLAFGMSHEGWDDVETHETKYLGDLDRRMKALAESTWHVKYLSIFDTLCTPRCSFYVAPNVPLLFDTDHLTPEASRLLVGAWRKEGAL
jgi:hypothetical protein